MRTCASATLAGAHSGEVELDFGHLAVLYNIFGSLYRTLAVIVGDILVRASFNLLKYLVSLEEHLGELSSLKYSIFI